MKIDYTIENKTIKVKSLDLGDNKEKTVTLYENSLPGISFLHIKVNRQRKVNSAFDAGSEAGIILSLQILSENQRFEFQSQNGLSANFTSSIESAQIISADTSFSHGYENVGTMNRLDIYIPSEKMASLLPQNFSDKIDKQRVLNLPLRAITFSSSLGEVMNLLIEKLEKPHSESLNPFFEKLIQSLTH